MVPVRIDMEAPTVEAVVDPAANLNGWNNSPVTVSFDAADSCSGVAAVTPPVLLAGDMTSVATVGDGYVGAYLLDSLFVISGAQVTTPDNIEAGEVTVDATSRLEANNMSLP